MPQYDGKVASTDPLQHVYSAQDGVHFAIVNDCLDMQAPERVARALSMDDTELSSFQQQLQHMPFEQIEQILQAEAVPYIRGTDYETPPSETETMIQCFAPLHGELLWIYWTYQNTVLCSGVEDMQLITKIPMDLQCSQSHGDYPLLLPWCLLMLLPQ